MDQSAQNVAALYLRPRHGPRVQSGIWRLKVQAPMRPGPVVVLDVGPEQALQVTPSEDEHVVEALPTNGAYPAFRERVRLRRPDERPHYRRSFRSEDLVITHPVAAAKTRPAQLALEDLQLVAKGPVTRHRWSDDWRCQRQMDKAAQRQVHEREEHRRSLLGERGPILRPRWLRR